MKPHPEQLQAGPKLVEGTETESELQDHGGADWSRAWFGLAYGVTPAFFVPCGDGSTQRVRIRLDD